MPRDEEEIQALETAQELAEEWGYGNIIHWLEKEWAMKLMRECGLSAKTAAAAAFMNDIHIQEFVDEINGSKHGHKKNSSPKWNR